MYQSLSLFLDNLSLGFSLVGDSTACVGFHTGSTFVDLYSSFLFLFYGDRNTFRWKNIYCLFLVVCDAGRHVLWWFSVLSVVVGEVVAAIEEKKKNPVD
jgi:hypothetical protein